MLPRSCLVGPFRAVAEAAKAEGPRWSINQLKVGDWFDCKDSYEQWQVAKVTSVTSSGLGVTYKGFSKYYDEVVPKTLARIAEVLYREHMWMWQ